MEQNMTGMTYKIRETAARIRELRELDTCQENALVAMQRLGLSSYKTLFKALPDGYPVPIIRGGRYDR